MKGFVGLVLRSFAIIILLILTYQCGDPQPKVSEEVLEIPVTLQVDRFDLEFDRTRPEELSQLQKKYSFLFPDEVPDSIWAVKLSDTLQQHIRREVQKAFPDFGPYQTALELLFKHIRYYFPDASVPRVITLTTNVDYQNRIILTDTLLLMGLDNYLGPDHEFCSNGLLRENPIYEGSLTTPDPGCC
ncbi:MAG: hypothetical protein P8X60_02250 [Robiginitalea sp.]